MKSETRIIYISTTVQYVLDKSTSTWLSKTWSGLTSFGGINIWADGTNIYCSDDTNQYQLDKSTSTWIDLSNKPSTLEGQYIWTDGTNAYYSDYSNETNNQYIFDTISSKWIKKILVRFY